MNISAIRTLFLRCSPAAITRFIVAVYVNAIHRHSFGTFAHIDQEVLELEPTVADHNPTSSVILVLRGVWIATPLHHALPADMCGRCPNRDGSANLYGLTGSNITIDPPSFVVSTTPATLPCRLIATINRAKSAFQDGRRHEPNRWIAMSTPTDVMSITPLTLLGWFLAAFNRARDSLISHWESLPPDVMKPGGCLPSRLLLFYFNRGSGVLTAP